MREDGAGGAFLQAGPAASVASGSRARRWRGRIGPGAYSASVAAVTTFVDPGRKNGQTRVVDLVRVDGRHLVAGADAVDAIAHRGAVVDGALGNVARVQQVRGARARDREQRRRLAPGRGVRLGRLYA